MWSAAAQKMKVSFDEDEVTNRSNEITILIPEVVPP